MARVFTLSGCQDLLSDGLNLCVGEGFNKYNPTVFAQTVGTDAKVLYRWRNGLATPAMHHMWTMLSVVPLPVAQHLLLPCDLHVERRQVAA